MIPVNALVCALDIVLFIPSCIWWVLGGDWYGFHTYWKVLYWTSTYVWDNAVD